MRSQKRVRPPCRHARSKAVTTKYGNNSSWRDVKSVLSHRQSGAAFPLPGRIELRPFLSGNGLFPFGRHLLLTRRPPAST